MYIKKSFVLLICFSLVVFSGTMFYAQMMPAMNNISVYKFIPMNNMKAYDFVQEIPAELKDIAALHTTKSTQGKEAVRKMITDIENEPVSAKNDWSVLKTGILYFEAGDYKKSEKLLQRLVDGTPKHKIVENALFYLGLIAGRDKNYQDAAFYFNRVIDLDRTHVNAYLNLGIAQLFLKDREKAEDSFENAAALDHDNPVAYFYLGVIKHDQGNNDAALASWQIAKRFERDGVLAQDWSDSLLAKDPHANALSQALKKNPNDVDAVIDMGNLYLSYGKSNLALESFKRALDMAPYYTQLHFSISEAYLQQEKFEDAKREVMKVLAKNNNQANTAAVYTAIGRICFYNHKYNNARINLERARDASDKNADKLRPQFLLTLLYAHQGDMVNTAIELEKYRQLNPGDKSVEELEGKIKRYKKLMGL